MNKKLVGSVIAILAVIALVTVFVLTRPDAADDSADRGMDMSQQGTSESNSDTTEPTETTTVEIKDFAFSPQVIKVKKGATVTWTNSDNIGHTVTGTNGADFDSGIMEQGAVFTHTFDETGTYSYNCTPHPNMTGKVIVE